MPEFPGRQNAFHKYIYDNLKYPVIGDVDVEGRVVLKFVVKKDGSIGKIDIVRSLHPAYDKEAVRLVREMPQWIPGKQNNRPVNVYFTLPIRFNPTPNE